MKEFPASTYILIEDYLSKQLPNQQMQEIANRIATESDFAKEVEWMEFFVQEMKETETANMLNKFQAIHKAAQQKTTIKAPNLVPHSNKKRNFILAASFLLLTTFSLYTIFSPPTKNQVQPIVKEQASWKNAFSYDQGQQLLGNGSLADEGLAFLSDGNIDQALPLLEQYLVAAATSEEGIDYNIQIEVGKIYLNKEAFQKAIDTFLSVTQSDAVYSYVIKAEYHLGIAYWAAGQKKQAIDLLTRLAKEGREPWNSKSRYFLVQEGITID